MLYHRNMASNPNRDWGDYGRMNASRRWRKQSAIMGQAVTEAIVAEARVEPGNQVLDVASGTGEPAISIATLLAGQGRVVASDLAAESLEIGRQRARERGLHNIEFAVADAHQLPFSDAEFDRVTSRLGIMFFADLPRALAEMRRVLKPGGRIVLLTWGKMEQPYFDATAGTVLRMASGARVPALAARMFRFGVLGTLSGELRDAGFENVQEYTKLVPWNWEGSPEELWEYFQAVTAPFKPLFDTVAATQKPGIDVAVLGALRGRVKDGKVKFDAEVVLASATR